MKNSEVAHLWAHQKCESARGSNFYFIGKSIYSWGKHFEAGRIVENRKGEKAYLVNNTKYSASTTQHQTYVINSIPSNSLVFYTNDFDAPEMAFVVKQLETIRDNVNLYIRSKTEMSYRNIWDPFEDMMKYIEFFDMETPNQILKMNVDTWLGMKHDLSFSSKKRKEEYIRELKRIWRIMLAHKWLQLLGTVNVVIDDILGDGTYQKYVDRVEKHKKKLEENEHKRLIAYRLKNEKKILEWKNHEIKELRGGFGFTYLRVNKDIVETSKGISITMEEARRLFGIIQYFRKNGFKHDVVKAKNGYTWKINNFENDILTAGCHVIEYSEIERVAKELGFL